MSDPLPPVTAWPAARPTGISPIQHPAWEAARNAILDLASEGPITAVIVGEPGTGKTWLLRELASSLGDHGFPTTMLMQGDLPMTVSDGAALLVDEASLMNGATRARMAAQDHGVVVLAAEQWLDDEPDLAAPSPVIIPLRTLVPDEIADFATEWLERTDRPAAIMDTAALSRLSAESGGRVGTIVHLLAEAAASWTQPPIELPDEIPAAIVGDTVTEPPLAHLAPPRRRKLYRLVLAGSAVAAMIVLGWALMPAPPPAPLQAAAQTPAPAAVVADASPASPLPAETTASPAPVAAPPLPLPPLRYAEIPAPALAGASTPAQSSVDAPTIVAPSAPDADATHVPIEFHTTPLPAIASAPTPPVLNGSDPSLIATFDGPAPAALPAPSKPFNRTGGPGLALIAQRGDTLARLYLSVYRDRRAPPYASVLAANPGPFKPGAIVVFPEPPGGWARAQR